MKLLVNSHNLHNKIEIKKYLKEMFTLWEKHGNMIYVNENKAESLKEDKYKYDKIVNVNLKK
jgi:hypothetical protein